MDTLSPEEQEKALRYLYNVRVYRYRSEYSEEQIARELGLESVEQMYQVMKEKWGWPDWVVYPEAPRPRRRPKGTAKPSEELPSLSNAVEPLNEGIEKLQDALWTLPYTRQWLKDGRIVTTAKFPKDTGWLRLHYIRKEFNRFDWEKVCKEHGQDPGVEEFKVPVDSPTLPRGAYRLAPKFLVQLIANYVVTGGDLETLLEILHPDPDKLSEKDLKDLEENHQKLLLAAQHLATLVRGGTVKQGPPREGISPDEHDAYWVLQDYEKYGWTDEDLPPSLRSLNSEEKKRIKGYRLPPREG